MLNYVKRITNNSNTKAGLFYFFGNILNKAVAFLTIPFFSRALSTAEYGIYTTYESWVSIMSVVVGMSLGNTIRNAYVDYKNELDSYISSITIYEYTSFLCFLIIGITVGRFSNVSTILICFCLFQSFFSSLISTYAIKYMMESRYIVRTLLIVLPNCLAMLISVPVVILMKKNLYLGRMIPELIITGALGLFLTFFIIKKGRGGFTVKKDCLKYALPLAIPMIFHGLSVNILSNSDRTIITYLVGESETGVYGLIYSFSMIASIVTSAMESVWIPWFTNKMKLNMKTDINSYASLYILETCFMVVMFMLISPEIVYLMADKKFWVGIKMLPPLVLSFYFVFLYSISVNLEYYYKKTKFIAINTISAGVVNILLNLLFVKRYGSTAAAYTTLVSYVLAFVFHFIYSKKLDHELFSFSLYVFPILFSVLSMVFALIAINHAVLRWISAGIVFVAACLFVVLRKKNREYEI